MYIQNNMSRSFIVPNLATAAINNATIIESGRHAEIDKGLVDKLKSTKVFTAMLDVGMISVADNRDGLSRIFVGNNTTRSAPATLKKEKEVEIKGVTSTNAPPAGKTGGSK